MLSIEQISKDEFIKLYAKMTIRAMAKKLGVSTVTISYWRDKFNLPHKRPRLIKK